MLASTEEVPICQVTECGAGYQEVSFNITS